MSDYDFENGEMPPSIEPQINKKPIDSLPKSSLSDGYDGSDAGFSGNLEENSIASLVGDKPIEANSNTDVRSNINMNNDVDDVKKQNINNSIEGVDDQTQTYIPEFVDDSPISIPPNTPLQDQDSALKEAIDKQSSSLEKDSQKNNHHNEKMQKINKKTGELMFKKNGKPVYCWSKKKKLAVFIPTTIIALLLISALIFTLIIQSNLNKSGMKGNIADIAKKSPLVIDKNNRVNVLIFGTSEDEAGHGGAQLADTIMVLSMDSTTGVSNTISIPRDMWVTVEENCSLGHQFKINATYPCGIQAGGSNDAGAMIFAKVVGKILGIDIPYYIRMDWGGLVDVVDAVGGIDVEPYTDSPKGIKDRVTGIDLPAGLSHIDGDTALRLSRSRNSHGGYGLSRSNFDREINQQIILNAVQKSAMSAGVLANPVRLAEIFNALGNHMLTNVKFSEVGSFADIAQKMKGAVSLPLTGKNKVGENVNLVVTGSGPGGASIVRPAAGIDDFTQIQQYIQQAFSSTDGVAHAPGADTNSATK